jgi:hypothetical protein
MPTHGSRNEDGGAAACSPRGQRRRRARSKAAAAAGAAASTGNGSGSSNKRGGSGSSGDGDNAAAQLASAQPLELQIREFPEGCAFVNKEYTVKVFAMDARKTLHRISVPLELVLFYANGIEVPKGEVARASPFRVSADNDMCAEVDVTFFTPSLNFNNEKVYFVVRPEGSRSGSNSSSSGSAAEDDTAGGRGVAAAPHNSLKHVTSSSVLVVRRRLVVLTKLPDLWFKDQGGREKHMTVTVEMRDGDDQVLCPTTPVPLHVKVRFCVWCVCVCVCVCARACL